MRKRSGERRVLGRLLAQELTPLSLERVVAMGITQVCNGTVTSFYGGVDCSGAPEIDHTSENQT